MPKEYYEAIAEAKRNTWLLFGVFIALLLAIGWLFGVWLGNLYFGTAIAMGIAIIWGAISWYSGDKVILKVSGARRLKKEENPYLYNLAEGLALAAGVPTPEMYIIDDPSPNSFATGRDPEHGKIAVTTGLLKMMDRAELEGVIAHEMSHIKNYDIRTMMVAAVLVGIIALLGQLFVRMVWFGGNRERKGGGQMLILAIGIVLIALSPVIAQLIKMAISRRREFLADATAVELTRNPDGIRSALEKLAADHTPLKRANGATAHLYIEDPIVNERGMFAIVGRWFSTHPPIEERIRRLKEMAQIG